MERLDEYEKLSREVKNIRSANNEVIEKFRRFEDTKKQASSQIQTYKVKINGKKAELDKTTSELESTQRQHAKAELDIEQLELLKFNVRVNIGQKELDQLENERKEIQSYIDKLDSDHNFAIATNKYLSILDFEEKIHQDKKTLENRQKEHNDLFEQRQILGQKLHSYLKREHDEVKGKHAVELQKLNDVQAEFKEHQQFIGRVKTELEQKQNDLSRFENTKSELTKKEAQLQIKYAAVPKITGGMVLKDEIDTTDIRIAELNEIDKQLSDFIFQEMQRLTKKEGESEKIVSEIYHVKEKLEFTEKVLLEYESQKNVASKVLEVRGFEGFEWCLKQIENELNETNRIVLDLEKNKERLELEIETIKEHGSSLNEDMKNALKWFRSEFGFAKSGAEYLKDLEEKIQREILNNAPWIVKSIILTPQDFNRIVNSPNSILPTFIMDSSVILTNQSSLQEQKKLSLGDIFVPSRETEHYIKLLDPETTIKRIERDIQRIGQDFSKYNSILEMANKDRDTIRLFLDKYPVEFEARTRQEISSHKESIEKHNAEHSSILESINKFNAIIEQKKKDKEDIQNQAEFLNENIIFLRELDRIINELTELELFLKECNSDIKELDSKSRMAKDLEARLENSIKEKESLLTALHDKVREIERDLKPLMDFDIVDIADLQEEEIRNLQPEFTSLNEVISQVAGDASSLERIIDENKRSIDSLWADIRRTKVNADILIVSERKVPYSNEYIEQLEKSKADHTSKLEIAINIIEDKRDKQSRLNQKFEDGVTGFNKKSPESFQIVDDLFDDTGFDAEIRIKTDDIKRLSEDIKNLESLHSSLEYELGKLRNNYEKYSGLDSFYQFSDIEAVLADELIDHNKMASLLKEISDKVDRSKIRYESAKKESIDAIGKLRVPPDFRDTIKDRLKTPGSFRESETIENNLNEYLTIIESKIQVQNNLVDSLKDVEEKVISQALGIAKIYRDYLKRFPSLSRIILNERSTEMIRINFHECEYTDDMAVSEMRHYIQQLIEDIEGLKISQKDLADYLTPVHLINKVLDMKNVSLSIRKIDTNDTKFQRWEKIQASDGQENAMFIIFMVVLMSYIRDIVVDRKDRNTSKVLIVDNPFGSTSACYLWEKIAAILEKNNVQIICPGHKISPGVREYFPVRHVLTEEISTDGRTRVSVKTSAKDEIMDKIQQQQRYGQLMLENYGFLKGNV
jgi:hypothetical protein